MNIMFFTTSPVMSNLVKNILATDNVTISTNPNSFNSDGYDLIMIEQPLFNRNISEYSLPILLLSTATEDNLYCHFLYELNPKGICLAKPFQRDDLISTINKVMAQ